VGSVVVVCRVACTGRDIGLELQLVGWSRSWSNSTRSLPLLCCLPIRCRRSIESAAFTVRARRVSHGTRTGASALLHRCETASTRSHCPASLARGLRPATHITHPLKLTTVQARRSQDAQRRVDSEIPLQPCMIHTRLKQSTLHIKIKRKRVLYTN
jgi:hypothetical protein